MTTITINPATIMDESRPLRCPRAGCGEVATRSRPRMVNGWDVIRAECTSISDCDWSQRAARNRKTGECITLDDHEAPPAAGAPKQSNEHTRSDSSMRERKDSTPLCGVPECDQLARTGGLCKMHYYARFQKCKPRPSVDEFIEAGGPTPAQWREMQSAAGNKSGNNPARGTVENARPCASGADKSSADNDLAARADSPEHEHELASGELTVADRLHNAAEQLTARARVLRELSEFIEADPTIKEELIDLLTEGGDG